MNRDRLTEEGLRAVLGHDGQGLTLCVLDEIDSTNNEAKRRALDTPKLPLLIAASRQTAGRGRMGRSFFSPADTGAYFSLMYQPAAPLSSAVSVTGKAAVAVMRAIRGLTGRQTEIKWVNDLYLDGKKICGILTEAVSQPGSPTLIIVGIGVNLTTVDFPDEISQRAGSLGDATLTREALIAAVWRELRALLQSEHGEWLQEYRAHSCVIGKPITWICDGKACHGEAVGINDRGELLVRLSDGSCELLRTGEISLLLNE